MAGRHADILTADRDDRPRISVAVGCIIVALAAVLRLHRVQYEALWFDEVYSATFAVRDVFDLLVCVARFDTHPPLYYLQLHFWALVSDKTTWLFLNSVCWSVASVASLYYTACRTFGRRVGTVAALVLATLPADVLYSHQLRMYAMVTCLGIWNWYLTRRALLTDCRLAALVWLAVAELAVIYSHMAGALDVGMFGLYGVMTAAIDRPDRKVVVPWLVMQVVVVVLALPVMVNSALRSLSHVTAPDLAQVADTLAFLTFGLSGPESAILRAVAVLLFVALAATAIWRPARATIAALVWFPIIAFYLMSRLLRPIWIDRGFLFLLPFLAIGIAALLVQGSRVAVRWAGAARAAARRADTAAITAVQYGTTAVALLVLVLLSFGEFSHDYKATPYDVAAAEVSRGLQPGDVVWGPNFITFWGVAWYLVGPDWGSPLQVQDSQRETRSDKWPEILARIGPVWQQRLHLQPKSRDVAWHHAELIIGLTPPPQLATASRIWLIDREQPDVPPSLFRGFLEQSRIDHDGVAVKLYVRRNGP